MEIDAQYSGSFKGSTMGKTNIDLFLGRPRNILATFGIWPSSTTYVVLLQIYMIFIMITQYSFVVFEIIYIAQVWGDIGAVSEASYLLFTQASVCYKTTLFLINKNSLIQLLELMGEKTFESQSEAHIR